MPLSDTEIIKQTKNGSIEAFEKLVVSYQQYIFKIAYGFLGNQRDAEDVVQDTFLTVYHQIKGLRNEAAFPSWLGKIATNFSLKKLSQNRKVSSFDSLEDNLIEVMSGEEHYLINETKDIVHQGLLKLPLAYRSAIVLRDIQGYSYKEIADILEVPLGTVKSRINQGRLLLADLLKDEMEEG